MPYRSEALRAGDRPLMTEHQVPFTVRGQEQDRNNVPESSVGENNSHSDGSVKHLLLDDDGDKSPSRDTQRRGSRERKQRLSEQERKSIAKFAKRQGLELMKELENQRLQNHLAGKHGSYSEEARSKIADTDRNIQEKSSTVDETEQDFSPPRSASRTQSPQLHDHDSIDSGRYAQTPRPDLQTNASMKNMVSEPPSKVLDWLCGAVADEKCILVSENRTLSLLHAINDHNGELRNSITSLPEDLVPVERLREAEQRSMIAEERLHHLEQLWKSSDAFSDRLDEDLGALLSKSKTMDRHFAHIKKFAEERLSGIKKLMERDGKERQPNVVGNGLSSEKTKRDLHEHEHHRNRLAQVFSTYNELLRLIKVERSKRLDAEHKTQQLASQLRSQTTSLKLAEKVIKHTASSPMSALSESVPGTSKKNHIVSTSSVSSGRQSPAASFLVREPSFNLSSRWQTPNNAIEDQQVDIRLKTPRGTMQDSHRSSPTIWQSQVRADSPPSPNHRNISKRLTYDYCDVPQALSRDKPQYGAQLSTSDLITKNGQEKFKDLEEALMDEVKSRGFADVNLYAEKKIEGKEETCWEYKHMHVDFNRPHSPSSLLSPSQVASSSLSSGNEYEVIDCNSASSFPSIAKKVNSYCESDEVSAGLAKQDPTSLDSGENVQNKLARSTSDIVSAKSRGERLQTGENQQLGPRSAISPSQDEAVNEGLFGSCEETLLNEESKRHAEGQTVKKLKRFPETRLTAGEKRQLGKSSSREHQDGDSAVEHTLLSGNLQRRLAAVEASYAALLLLVKIWFFVTVVTWIDFPASPWWKTAPPT